MGGSSVSKPAPVPDGLPKNIPQHIAVIMDGNGRWAKARNLPRMAGHRAGVENLRRVIEGCVEDRSAVSSPFTLSPPKTGCVRRRKSKG